MNCPFNVYASVWMGIKVLWVVRKTRKELQMQVYSPLDESRDGYLNTWTNKTKTIITTVIFLFENMLEFSVLKGLKNLFSYIHTQIFAKLEQFWVFQGSKRWNFCAPINVQKHFSQNLMTVEGLTCQSTLIQSHPHSPDGVFGSLNSHKYYLKLSFSNLWLLLI